MILMPLCAVLYGCTGGGDDADEPLEFASWARMRADSLNSGRAAGSISNNPGRIALVDDLSDLGVTGSTPAMGANGVLYVGTERGLLAIDPWPRGGRVRRWLFDTCESPGDVGPIDGSPAVTAGGDIVVGTNGGRVFRLHDDATEPVCEWVYPRAGSGRVPGGILSSPALRIDPVTAAPGSIFFTAEAGFLLALNRDGSERWRFQPAQGPVTGWSSSPAISSDGVLYATAPDGYLYALDLYGTKLWQYDVKAGSGGGLLTSPAVSLGVYVAGADGVVRAINPGGGLRWRSKPLPRPVPGSLAYANQTIELSTPTPGSADTPPGTSPPPDSTPTRTRTPETVSEVVVYAADDSGAVHLLRDANGSVYRTLRFAGERAAVPVSGSPILSADQFVVLGAGDGFLYASDIDGGRPCVTPTIDAGITPTPTPTGRIACADSNWRDTPGGSGARVDIGSPIRSVIIAKDGTIFVTAEDGKLYSLPVPNQTTIVPTFTPTATPTPTAPSVTQGAGGHG